MNILETVLASGVKPVFDGIGQLAKDIRIAITGKDPEKMAEIALKAQEIEAQANQAQIAVNMVEAQNPNLFVAGWRPFVGWVCGFALLYHYILNPIVAWGFKLYDENLQPPPTLDLGDLFMLLMGMLGFGLLRTVEKTRNVEGNR